MHIPRLVKWVLWAVTAIFFVLLSLAFFIWVLLGPSKDEAARVVSPCGNVDAVLVETNGGATTSFGYNVSVVEHGASPNEKPVAQLYAAIRNEHAYGLNMHWEDGNLLIIEYMKARSAKLEKDIISVNGKIFRVAMRSEVVDPSAPSGGMLFNLQGRK